MKTDRFLIRAYKPADYKGVIHVWEVTGMGGSVRGDNDVIIKESLDIGGKFLVMIDTTTNNLVGTSWMTFNGRRLYLHHFGIDPVFQNQGLGQKLARATLNLAKQKKVQIKLEVHRNNKAAIELYKKLGFKYLGDYDVYIIRDVENIKC
jgi:ribosomal protein S18 acetylase RimI-like enzyme